MIVGRVPVMTRVPLYRSFDHYHTRGQHWSGFFCLPTGAGFRGVKGIMSPRLWVLGELVSIRSVFPRPTLRDTVSKQTAAAFWVPSMQGIQQAIQTSPKRPGHSPAVCVFRGHGAVRPWVLSGAAGGLAG